MFARYKRCRENVIPDDYENTKKVKKVKELNLLQMGTVALELGRSVHV